MSSSSSSHNKNIIASHYQIAQKIGEGSFGIIFKGYDLLRDNEPVAIKFESRKSEAPQLKDEFKAYKILNNAVNEYISFHSQQQKALLSSSISSSHQNSQSKEQSQHQLSQTSSSSIQSYPSSQSHSQPQSQESQPDDQSSEQSHSQHSNNRALSRHYLSVEGIPKVYYFGQEGYYNILIIQLLGPSLEDLFEWCGRRFSAKTVAQVAKQMIKRIQFVHENDLIYRDIKPDNFLVGSENQKDNTIYLVDFGMIKQYRNPITKQHIPYRERKSLSGTARYMSINTHLGREQSRRDDLESLGHVFLYFLKGELPWQGLKAQTNKLKYEKIGEKKQSTPISELCYKLPIQFAKYLSYVRNLRFEEEPNYAYLVQLMDEVLHDLGTVDDGYYDWMSLNDGKGWSWNKNKKTNLNGYGSNQRNMSNTNNGTNSQNRINSKSHQQQQAQLQQQQQQRSTKGIPPSRRQSGNGNSQRNIQGGANENTQLLSSNYQQGSGQQNYGYYNQQQIYDDDTEEAADSFCVTKLLKSVFCCL